MLRVRNVRAFHHSVRRLMAENASAAGATIPSKVTLNLTSPYEKFFVNAQVDLIQIPGAVGEYGVTAGHSPIVSQLKPGVVKVHVNRDKDVQSFFTSGGFAFTHEDSTTDIACVELVRVQDIDINAATQALAKYQSQIATFAEGSRDRVQAQIAVETLTAALAAANAEKQ